MNRISIINNFIKKFDFKNYLEIGIQNGHCFTAIECENKTGVDPDISSAATIHKTSDDFFATNKKKFEIIFIDGLHEAETVYRDIMNSLDCLEEGGVILMHDCCPTNEFMQMIPLTTQNEWTGNVWEAYVKVRQERDDLEMLVADCDWGVGVIRKIPDGQPKAEKLIITEEINYANFEKNKVKWLNLVSPQVLVDYFNS